ncbi:hypothetical protein JX266_005391 [Neoarthrinium moseri]|nr:hypothetical protein JX266_005391 [Neoarthrinium moseri]
MDVSYRNNLLGLAALNWVLLVSQPTRRSMLNTQEERVLKKDPTVKLPPQAVRHPQGTIYKVYFFIAISAWFNEIFLNNLYRQDYDLTSRQINYLTLTSLITSGLSSLFVGALADKYGRKSTNVLFSGCYGASVCLAMIPELPALYAGRVLGGFATAIVFSVMDSWIVFDFFARKLIHQGCDLYRTFGTLAVINAFAAVACSVIGDRLVWATGSNKAPFIVSWLVMWQAMQALWSKFKEVYGASATDDREMIKNTPSVIKVFKRPYMWALTLAITVFEGSALLFAFSAAPVLKSVHKSSRELPLTYVFACIMASALVGSLSFNIVMVRRKLRFSRLLTGILVLSNFVFFKLSRPKTERGTFWLSCLFGLLIGLYYPCISTLKARLIEEGVRATVYSLMRAPAYLFVVTQLILNSEAASTSKIFSISSMGFTAAFAAVWVISFNKKIP